MEQYKFLKSLYTHGALTPAYCKRRFGKKTFHRTFEVLVDKKLVSITTEKTSNNETIIRNYKLTQEGENTYLVLHQSRSDFWHNIITPKLLDVIIAFATAAITTEHWQSIKAFFLKLVELVSALFH